MEVSECIVPCGRNHGKVAQIDAPNSVVYVAGSEVHIDFSREGGFVPFVGQVDELGCQMIHQSCNLHIMLSSMFLYNTLYFHSDVGIVNAGRSMDVVFAV